MKETIRLTESMFRQIVKEAINELDLKNGENAADNLSSRLEKYYAQRDRHFELEVIKIFNKKLNRLPSEVYKNLDKQIFKELWEESELEAIEQEDKMYNM